MPPTVFTVSELNNNVKFLLEEAFERIHVEGEISNFAAPTSGHWYFTLKDNNAQVRCALFKGSQRRIQTTPKDGMHVTITARASLYPARGEYQLIAEHLEEQGQGKLQQAFEALKKKLSAAGWFDADQKQVLPTHPNTIGVVTSPTGAAIHDILTVLKRRYPIANVVIYPTLVQGQEAPAAIAKAIKLANQRKECEVLIVGRGGGSLEDLWAFNEEIVARAIYDSDLPIVSAVGHEVDFTIADFVADVRAPTPSAAAEILTPDQSELLAVLARQKQQLAKHMQNQLNTTAYAIDAAEKHLHQHHPKQKIAERLQYLKTLSALCHQSMLAKLNAVKLNLGQAAATLDALSPLSTLMRGFSIAMKDKHVITQAAELKPDDKLTLTFVDGCVNAIIT
ncbi:MAG TPA: exodeoxyribonuclease VII large subunit [Gammaproteobacteria bacterium]|nr:exodeoxyribonuclease VII large subunit [Gammaproteobacteria bacterium]